jgi:HK97 family phage major capsid protein
MNKKLKELIEQRAAALAKAEALVALSEKENRAFTDAEQTAYTGHIGEVRGFDTKITQAKEQAELRKTQDALALEQRNANPTARAAAPVDMSVQGEYSEEQIRAIQGYSYLKGIRQMLTQERCDGVELEMHQEAQREACAAGTTIEGNFGVPLVVLQRAGLRSMETRAITATGQTSAAGDQGGLAIQTNVGSIIERFYAKLLVKKMGTRILDGLVGNLLFPRHVTDDEAAVKGENNAAPVTSSTMNSITLSPRRVPVVLEISRQFSMQTSPSVEAYLRDDISFQIAKIIDTYCISGTGSSGQPYGILNTAGIATLYAGATVSIVNGVPTITAPASGTNANGAALSYADIVLLERAIAIADADMGKLGFITNPQVRAALKLTPKIGSTYPTFVWPDSGQDLIGYNAGVTTQMPANGAKGSSTTLSSIIYGNWDDAVMGQWGGLDMLINPYSKDDQGIIRINAWSFFDFNVRRPKSFAAILDAAA